MLMMSRRAGESILIGDDVEIVIAQIGRKRVRVGIRAPRTTAVIAQELILVREENLAAAAAPLRDGPSDLLLRLMPSVQTPSIHADEGSDRQEAGTEN
jgi:carbon storage regulator